MRKQIPQSFFTVAVIAIVLALVPHRGAAQSAAQGPAQTPPPAINGKWEATLGSGDNKLHLGIEVYTLPTGALSGELNSPDQGVTLQMSAIKLTGNKFHFEVSRVGGVYDGTITDDASQVHGTWTQSGISPQTLNFHRPGAEPAATPAQPTTKPLTAPLDVIITNPPTVFAADGKAHMVYELHITNFTRYDSSLVKIEVLPNDSESPLVSFTGAPLEEMILRPGQPGVKPKSKIAAGATAVVYMWVTVPGLHDAPSSLRHRITMTYAAYPEQLSVVTPAVNVNHKSVITISPPLRGDNWLAGNGPSNTSAHRRALLPINGSARIAQRFAIDWVRLYPDGKTFANDPKDNKNYRAYGSEALAVADGTVSETLDGVPQNIPGEDSRAQEITLENVAGNHVVLNLGNGMYALYAHLQPGSLKVRTGEKVHRGEVLGLVGNSGNSTEPHLHFHICDAPSPLGCEGLPYAFSEFQVIGHGWGFKSSESHAQTETHPHEMPLEDQVVWFPQEPKSPLLRIHK
jgi:murein DD-endopeptidase